MYRRNIEIEWGRVAKIIVALVISCAVGYFFQPMVSKNKDAVNTVVTIFSILAGFLIALITLISEPTLRQAKDWRELQMMKNTIERKLLRQKILFFMYLLTLGVALSTFLIPDNFECARMWVESVFLALATFVFIASFGLPGSLMKIQMERYSAAMDETKPSILKDIDKTIESD
ncbi:hypothetical protein [Xanthobacter agilis]|uniref:Small-conductance mechanosensitive channel n=1 Tax=Xanthobacter agilis TaxID=47492 RepID=A0ABU0L977_XANAG|nr:hypothetical protein [Xanthobacter agilis]MDQ0503690.1 small-conductance mechanosensitive channel [Xanthobacter agilis]